VEFLQHRAELTGDGLPAEFIERVPGGAVKLLARNELIDSSVLLFGKWPGHPTL